MKSSSKYWLALAAAGILLLPGCNRRTPEERFQQAAEYMQQGDRISAEVELKQLVEKSPDDPMSLQARMGLVQLYMADRRFDEAAQELESLLQKVDQRNATGQQVLNQYLSVLKSQKKFPEAIKVVDEYQQKYADDEGVSLSLAVGRADIQIQAGETTPAREALSGLMDQTTNPAEMNLYRQLIARSLAREGDTTGALSFYEQELSKAQGDRERLQILQQLAGGYAALGAYEKNREALERTTRLYDEMMSKELDANARLGLTQGLGEMYLQSGNLRGARRVYQALFDTNPQDPELVLIIANMLGQALLRSGDYDAAIGFLKEAANRYPSLPLGQEVERWQQMKASGEISSYAPEDTSTLVMRYKEAPVLAPENLPTPAAGTSETTPSVTQEPGSRLRGRSEGTKPAAMDSTSTEAASPAPQPSAVEVVTTAPSDAATTSADTATTSVAESASTTTPL